VICAAGREPRTQNLNFQKPNIKLSTAGKILGRHEQSQTSAHVYAVGDVLEGAVEFSQVSEAASQLLMRRLYTGSMTHTDYERVMTSVLTSLEYCACGFTETEATLHYGAESVLVYQAPIRTHDACIQLGNCADYAFCKALFLKSEQVNFFVCSNF
jgi:glutathione reductase (NADPH)